MPNLDVTVTFEPENGWVRTTMTGELPPEMMPDIIRRILTLAAERQCGYALMDYTGATLTGSLTDLYSINSRLGQLGVRLTHIVAVVHSAATNQGQRNEFAEAIAHNRGFQNIRYFTDLSAAQAWLREQQAG